MNLMVVGLIVAAGLMVLLFMVMREERTVKQNGAAKGIVEALWDGQDRRQHPRWKLSCPMRYRLYPGHERDHDVIAKVEDAGNGGIAARLPESLATGVWLECDITPAYGVVIRVRGEVRWSKEIPHHPSIKQREFMTGIQFHSIPPADLQRLIELAQPKESV